MYRLLFGVHMHQPIDNPDWVIKEAVEKCYAPFFETMSKYPEFKFSFHSSGWILEKIKKEYSEVFENIKKCNIETFTGGFYEPVLSVWPKKDIKRQIIKHKKYIKENFKQIPFGIWPAERVWEDSLIEIFNQLDLKYVILDDYHLKMSGYEKTDRIFITEKEGKAVKIFPINKRLRYAIPFYEVEDALKEVKKYDLAVMFDDLEKFGLWPDTYEWVYKKGWLEKFVEEILNTEIKTLHFKEIKDEPSLAYIEPLSYEEMSHWAMERDIPENCKNYAKGNIWKHFFSKYPESNYMHKRVLSLSKRSESEEILKAQCNDAYWHGIFGGVYLSNLRDSVYYHIYEAQKDIEEYMEDFDFDERKEAVFKKEKTFFVLDERGVLKEFFYEGFNFQNLIKRKIEKYAQEKKEKSAIDTIHTRKFEIPRNLKEHLINDNHIRNSFLFINSELSLEDFFGCNYEIDESSVNFDFEKLEFSNDKLYKRFFLKNKELKFELKGSGWIELNLRSEKRFSKQKLYTSFIDLGKIRIEFDNTEVLIFDIYTISKTEKGYAEEFQGVSMALKLNDKLKGRIYVRD